MSNCSICGKPWEKHYAPDMLKFKLGPFGTFGLTAEHTPHIPGVHMPRRVQCTARIWHGPGHQSSTKCRRTDQHELHEAVYGAMQRFVQWHGEEAYTGFFDEPPDDDED